MKYKDTKKLLHDLSNVLCACSGYTELLLDKEDRDYQKKILSHMKSSINRFNEILKETATKHLKKEEQRPEDID